MSLHRRLWLSIDARDLLCSADTQKSWIITYHPGLAAEVVDGVEGVDRVDAAVLEANDEAAEVFPQSHAVGVLADQDKIRLERSGRDEENGVLLSNAPEALLTTPCFFTILPFPFH